MMNGEENAFHWIIGILVCQKEFVPPYTLKMLFRLSSSLDFINHRRWADSLTSHLLKAKFYSVLFDDESRRLAFIQLLIYF